ncbi:MAG: ASCH domain-containing protein [Alphaproteobacteria bacterium]|nr:ASCH domain-containing protein [Alphaproteobacteria bacterium]
MAYSFKARFADPIETGQKRQTIRKDRRRHARPGETIQLYTAQRTIHCRLIGTATCVAVHRIEIGIDAGEWADHGQA